MILFDFKDVLHSSLAGSPCAFPSSISLIFYPFRPVYSFSLAGSSNPTSATATAARSRSKYLIRNCDLIFDLNVFTVHARYVLYEDGKERKTQEKPDLLQDNSKS